MKNKLNNREIGKRIKELRLSRGISQDALAEMLDISVSHMGILERGGRGLTLPNCVLLCNIFNVSADYIATGRGESP